MLAFYIHTHTHQHTHLPPPSNKFEFELQWFRNLFNTFYVRMRWKIVNEREREIRNTKGVLYHLASVWIVHHSVLV